MSPTEHLGHSIWKNCYYSNRNNILGKNREVKTNIAHGSLNGNLKHFFIIVTGQYNLVRKFNDQVHRWRYQSLQRNVFLKKQHTRTSKSKVWIQLQPSVSEQQ